MFSIGFGSEKREQEILKMLQSDRTTAVILAAVHFEWMIKRSILKLGISPTRQLRKELADIYRIDDKGKSLGYKSIWKREVKSRFSGSALGPVLGNLHDIKETANKVRGLIVHGNGTVSVADARAAVNAYILAGKKLRDFANQKGEDIDARLNPRINCR